MQIKWKNHEEAMENGKWKGEVKSKQKELDPDADTGAELHAVKSFNNAHNIKLTNGLQGGEAGMGQN